MKQNAALVSLIVLGLLPVGEMPRRLDHEVDVLPGQLRGVALAEDLDLPAVDLQRLAVGFDFPGERSERGVVAQQVSERLGVGQVIDGDEFDAGIAEPRPQYVAADAAETVNRDFDAHISSPPRISM